MFFNIARRWPSIVLILMVSFVMRLAGFATATPTTSPNQPSDKLGSWAYVVFISSRDGNNEIYRMASDGSQVTRLTYTGSDENDPQVRHGGQQIVFERSGSIYTMNSDGSQVRRIINNSTGPNANPTWSPDGTRIAFEARRDGRWAIFVAYADGSGQARLTPSGADKRFPAWNRFTGQIAYFSLDAPATGQGQIYLTDPAGAAHTPYGAPTHLTGGLRWNEDGSGLSWVSDPNDTGQIGLVLPDGKLLQPEAGFAYGPAAFAPDGSAVWSSIHNLTTGAWDLIRFSPPYTPTNLVPTYLTSVGVDRAPAWAITDAIPPTSWIEGAPRYAPPIPFKIDFHAEDQGGSGVNPELPVEWRIMDGPWQPLPLWRTIFSNQPIPWQWLSSDYLDVGDRVSFRLRAWDFAHNQAPETTPQYPVTVMAGWLSGRLSDGRGVPLAEQDILPDQQPGAVTDTDGRFDALVGSPAQTILLSRPGYGQPPTLTPYVDRSAVANAYLPGPDNLLLNPDFEDELSGWFATGQATVITHTRFSNNRALRLGSACNNPHQETCLPAARPGITGGIPSFIVQPDDSLELLYADLSHADPFKWYARTRTPGGAWLEPQVIASYNFQSGFPANHVLRTSDGALHWVDQYGTYYQKPAGQPWQPIEGLPTDGCPMDFAAHTNGDITFAYKCSPQVDAFRRNAFTGEWGYEKLLGYENYSPDIDPAGYGPAVATAPDGATHFIFRAFEPDEHIPFDTGDMPPFHALTRLPDGRWEPLHILLFNQHAIEDRKPDVVVGPDGTTFVYIFGEDLNNRAAIYEVSRRSYLQAWSAAVEVPGSSLAPNPADVFMDQAGNTHLLSLRRAAGQSGYEYFYQRRSPNGAWTRPQYLFYHEEQNGDYPKIGADSHGNVIIIASDGAELDIYSSPTAAQTRTDRISQRLSLPAAMHRPTLSGMLQINAAPHSMPAFQVDVTAGLTTTTVYSAAAVTNWALFYADLTPWAGQTVTITLSANQNLSDTAASVFLDNLSLSSWLTPVPEAAQIFETTTGPAIEIFGNNFLPGVAVTLDGRPLYDLHLTGDFSITTLAPSWLIPGRHSLIVTNPGGQTTRVPINLQYGIPIYLPVVRK